MTATAYSFGHVCYYNDDQWLYVDTKEPIPSCGGLARRCPKCGQYPTSEGYDPCLGFVPEATSVCCGHGVTDPINLNKGEK